jgi:uncharacterized glyoxalase superfamily protein PhnB
VTRYYAGMKTIYPLIITDKIKEAAKFHIDTFGFKAVFEQDWYIQLLHEPSGSELAFMIPNAENQPAFLHPKFNGEGVVLSFEVDDARAEYDRISKVGTASFTLDYTEEEWGQKHFIIRDPSGAYIDVVEQATQ